MNLPPMFRPTGLSAEERRNKRKGSEFISTEFWVGISGGKGDEDEDDSNNNNISRNNKS